MITHRHPVAEHSNGEVVILYLIRMMMKYQDLHGKPIQQEGQTKIGDTYR